MKDTNEEPDEEIHRARSGKVPNIRTSVALKLGSSTCKYYSHGPMITQGESNKERAAKTSKGRKRRSRKGDEGPMRWER